MAESTENEIHAMIGAEFGVDTRSLEFRTTDDQVASLRHDLVRIRAYPLLPERTRRLAARSSTSTLAACTRYRSTRRTTSPAGQPGQSRRE